jgi:hypothetical protein
MHRCACDDLAQKYISKALKSAGDTDITIIKQPSVTASIFRLAAYAMAVVLILYLL